MIVTSALLFFLLEQNAPAGRNAETSLLSLLSFCQSILDPYSDLLFIVSLYRMDGWSPLTCMSLGHLLSTLPANCCMR